MAVSPATTVSRTAIFSVNAAAFVSVWVFAGCGAEAPVAVESQAPPPAVIDHAEAPPASTSSHPDAIELPPLELPQIGGGHPKQTEPATVLADPVAVSLPSRLADDLSLIHI